MQTAAVTSRPLLAGGWLDLVQTNGWEGHNGRDDPEWASETTRVFRNLTAVSSELTFADVAEQAGLVHRGQGRGLVHLDYDNDGDQDLVIFNNAGSSGRTPYGGRVRTRAGPRIPRIFMVGHVRVFRLFRRGWPIAWSEKAGRRAMLGHRVSSSSMSRSDRPDSRKHLTLRGACLT